MEAMEAMYQIESEPSGHLVIVLRRGFWVVFGIKKVPSNTRLAHAETLYLAKMALNCDRGWKSQMWDMEEGDRWLFKNFCYNWKWKLVQSDWACQGCSSQSGFGMNGPVFKLGVNQWPNSSTATFLPITRPGGTSPLWRLLSMSDQNVNFDTDLW